MATIYLVRHGKAAAGFDGHPDPGLDDLGRVQAAAGAEALAGLGRMPIWSSPLARARETALPLAERWGQEILIEDRVAEIPSPSNDLAERSAWLRGAMAGNWSDLSTELQSWRQALASCLLDITENTVVFSHFIAINAAVGLARDDDRLVVFAPDNGSITTLDNSSGRLSVRELGQTATQTRVN